MREVRWVEAEGKLNKVAGLVIDYSTCTPQVVYEGRVIRLGNDLATHDDVERYVWKGIVEIQEMDFERRRKSAWGLL